MEVSELSKISQEMYISRGLFATLQLGPVIARIHQKSLNILYNFKKSIFIIFWTFYILGGIAILPKKYQFSLVSRFSLGIRSWRTFLFISFCKITPKPIRKLLSYNSKSLNTVKKIEFFVISWQKFMGKPPMGSSLMSCWPNIDQTFGNHKPYLFPTNFIFIMYRYSQTVRVYQETEIYPKKFWNRQNPWFQGHLLTKWVNTCCKNIFHEIAYALKF